MAMEDVVVLSIDTSIITFNFIKNSALKYQDYSVQLKKYPRSGKFWENRGFKKFWFYCTSTLYVYVT